MAHANLHLAAGIAVGTAIAAWPVARAWWAAQPVARPLVRLLIVSYGLGLWAVVPNALTTLGAPASVHHAWWADVFLLHARIDARIDRGLLIGELAIAAAFVGHYLLLLLALRRAGRGRGRPRPGSSPPAG